jgi:hypothetical protein
VDRIDRRAFLGLGAGALAWACARGGGESAAPTATPSAADLSVFLTSPQLAVGDTRMGFALVREGKPITPEDVRVTLVPPSGPAPGPIRPETQTVRFGQGGETDHEHPEGTEVQDIFVFRHTFEATGFWTVEVETGSQSAQGSFQLLADDPSPQVGEQAIAVLSPTTEDARGADPICTRTPPCSMHDATVAAAIEADTPAVLVFATPRYCTTRTCGPVVDIVEAAKEQVGDAASFVHVEVWRDAQSVNTPDGFVEAFAAWGFQTEPWTYFLRPDGTVADRWMGALGREETLAEVSKLVAGEI